MEKNIIRDFYESSAGHLILEPSMWPEELDHMMIAENYWLLGRAHGEMVVADFGCGHGRHLVSLADAVHEIHGIDNSKSMLDVSRKNTQQFRNVYLHERDAAETSLPSNSIDLCICMFNSFNNFPHQASVLSEMKRVCKRDGTIVLSVYSESAAGMQEQFYRNISQKLGVKAEAFFVTTTELYVEASFETEDHGNVTLRSERCSINRIHRMFGTDCLVKNLEKVGYLCLLRNK
jgi:ubiquinone/menaquinone biosynthesis C-methylase UbiE